MSTKKKEIRAPSNLEVLVREGILKNGTTVEGAVDQLLTELNCLECIAAEQCADCFGKVTIDRDNPRCREVVTAYLKQDYIRKNKED